MALFCAVINGDSVWGFPLLLLLLSSSSSLIIIIISVLSVYNVLL